MRALLICCWTGLLATSLLLSACATNTGASSDYTLYLMRHAEKVADNSKDPDLTDAGKTRADNIAERLQDKGIRDVWSSDYQRTRETAAPLAKELGLKVKIYDPKDQSKLITQLKKRHQNALIVGHSNTIPELADMLCNCDVAEMEEAEYNRLIVIHMLNGKAELQTLSQ